MYVAVPIASGGVIRGAVRITYPTATLAARVNRYWLLLAAIGGVVLAAATVVGLLFARTLTRPLSKLEQTAAAVGAGDLQARAPTDSGPPEIRALASELNETVSRLDALIRSQQEFVADASHQLRTPLAALRLRLENLDRDVDDEGKPSLEAALAEVNRLATPGRRAPGARTRRRVAAETRADRPRRARLLPPRCLVGRAGRPRGHGAGALAGGHQRGDAGLARAGARQPVPQRTRRPRTRRTDHARGRHGRHDARAARSRQRPRDDRGAARAGARPVLAGGPPGAGTGLGLAIVHRLVTADGGTVELREADGGGLDVVLRLPAAVGLAPAARAPEGRGDVSAARVAFFALVAVVVAVTANLVLLGIATGPKDPVGSLSPRAGLVLLPASPAAPATTITVPQAATTTVTTSTTTSPAPATPSPTTPAAPAHHRESPAGSHQDD